MSNFQFGSVPVIKHSRSRFDLSHSVKTAFNVGDLVPFDVQEVYAGDTFKVKTFSVSRLSNQFLRPVMDNLFLDVYYFFVPSRILYDKFVNIFGENTESAWVNQHEYEVPMIDVGEVAVGSVADYMGLPLGNNRFPISVLPFRAFAKVYDDWFRDQNNIDPMHIQKGDIAVSEGINQRPWSPSNYTGMLPKVSKFHDLFTSALPSPQKGSAVDLPLAFGDSFAPVRSLDQYQAGGGYPVHLVQATGVDLPAGNHAVQANGSTLSVGTTSISTTNVPVMFDNLYADLNGLEASPITVNDLRFAFQYQKLLERDARSGTRFVEYLQSHFGVSPGDYKLQRSEFLGGKRTPLSVHQVTQTTGEGSDSSPLASVGAFSLSNGSSRFTKGFTENGYVISCACIRQFHTYQQGTEKFWFRSKRIDFFDPVFSNIGEQPVYTKELYNGLGVGADTVFGYQEAWIDLRYRPSRVTGQMRTGVDNSLDVWHFSDYYDSMPVLSKSFIEETPQFVNRAITVDSSEQAQFIVDFYIQNIAYRELPTYSVPSLIDHN